MFSIRYKKAIIILVIAFIFDFLIRLFFYNRMKLIVPAEAVLFLSSSLFMFLASRRDKSKSLKVQRIDLWLTLFFLLGGIRSALWSVNVEIYIANLIIIVMGIVIGTFLIRWRGNGGNTD